MKIDDILALALVRYTLAADRKAKKANKTKKRLSTVGKLERMKTLFYRISGDFIRFKGENAKEASRIAGLCKFYSSDGEVHCGCINWSPSLLLIKKAGYQLEQEQ